MKILLFAHKIHTFFVEELESECALHIQILIPPSFTESASASSETSASSVTETASLISETASFVSEAASPITEQSNIGGSSPGKLFELQAVLQASSGVLFNVCQAY